MTTRDARECERIARAHARTFTLASRFLPAPKRRAAFALYAFCRVADDMVDSASVPHDLSVERRLAIYGRRLAAALDGRPDDEVFRELAWVVREYDVPAVVLHELLAGVARDLRPARYETWPDLARYCAGVASSVGEMCTYVFGVVGGADERGRALRHARTLGVAMQLTNILRDIGEDAARGRCYLPDEDLERHGLDRQRVLERAESLAGDSRWTRLMRFEIERARSLYASATPGITLLAPDARRCAAAAACGYAGILSAIERSGYDTVSARARIGHFERLGVLWNVYRNYPGSIAPIRDAELADWEIGFERAPQAELMKWA